MGGTVYKGFGKGELPVKEVFLILDMIAEQGNIVCRHRLGNGIELILLDRSRVTAGDRWLVELKCQAHIKPDESFWAMVAGEDPALQEDIREKIGDRLVFETTKQRNFIDADERETVLQEMVRQVYTSMLEYLKKPHFPQEFFKKQYRETRKKLLIERAMNRTSDSR